MTAVYNVPSGVLYEDDGDSKGVTKEGDDEDSEVLCLFLSCTGDTDVSCFFPEFDLDMLRSISPRLIGDDFRMEDILGV